VGRAIRFCVARGQQTAVLGPWRGSGCPGHGPGDRAPKKPRPIGVAAIQPAPNGAVRRCGPNPVIVTFTGPVSDRGGGPSRADQDHRAQPHHWGGSLGSTTTVVGSGRPGNGLLACPQPTSGRPGARLVNRLRQPVDEVT